MTEFARARHQPRVTPRAGPAPSGPAGRGADLLQLQRTAGNRAATALVVAGSASVQRQTHSRSTIVGWVKALVPRDDETLDTYLRRFYRKYQAQGFDPEDKSEVKRAILKQWKSDLRMDDEQAKEETVFDRAAAAARGTPFVSLDTDAGNNFYTLKRKPSNKIKKPGGRGGWESYCPTKTPEEASEEAISGLDLTGSYSAAHARHDFQDATAGTVNLQVQLGGSSGNYRVGKGDTSWTVVVISQKLWDAMRTADSARWKSVIQAAHRESLRDGTRIEMGAPS